MINEYVTLGKKSLCHHMTGWLDLFVLVSLKVQMGCEVCRLSRPAHFSFSFCTSPVMSPGHLPWALWSPAIEDRWRGHNPRQDRRLQWEWNSGTLAELGALSKHESWPISFYHSQHRCALHHNSPWEPCLCAWHGAATNSCFLYLKSDLWSVQWGWFFLQA